ncbi:MAG: response regulator [Deltaproteobacteria bacterium]|nr:response regulator [Deltaproteobacteria bacterium]
MNKMILVVDDEKDIVELVAYNLNREGYQVARAYDGRQALQLIRENKPDLVILDLMLPGISGFEVCRLIRKKTETEGLPIIMLTAKSDSVDKIMGLEIGADDYLTKPFNVRELVARVRAVLRRWENRTEQEDTEKISVPGLEVDFRTYEVMVEGEKIALGPTELKLVRFLVTHPGRVYSRDRLLDNIWGNESFVEPRTVDVHISRLRAAIEKDKDDPRYILTVRGIGYKFAEFKAV